MLIIQMPSWPQGWCCQPFSRKKTVEGVCNKQPPSPQLPQMGAESWQVPASSLMRLCGLICELLPAILLPPLQCPGEVCNLHQHLPSPWAPTRLLLPGGSQEGSGFPLHLQHRWSQHLQEREWSPAISRPFLHLMQRLWLFASNGNKSYLLHATFHYKTLLYSLYWSTFLFV